MVLIQGTREPLGKYMPVPEFTQHYCYLANAGNPCVALLL